MKRLTKRSFLAAMVPALALPFVVTGCGGNNTEGDGGSPQASSPGSSSGKQYKLAFVTNNASDFWTYARRGTEKADKELNDVTVEFRNPGEGTAAEQTRTVNDLLSTTIDGMAISPVDPANQTQMLNDAAKKIVVFTQDSDAPKSDRACYIGTDNHAAGVQAGELMKKSLPNGGQIMLFVGKKDAQNAADRAQGVADALKGSNIKIIDTRTDDTDRARAVTNVSDTITKYPNIAGLIGLWSYNGPAILKAVQSANKTGKIKIVAFDEEEDTLSGVTSGAIDGTIVQQPFEFGYQSIINMSKYLHGDKSFIPANKTIIVQTKVITKDNVKEFQTNLEKMKSS